MWVCSASKVLSGEVQSESLRALDPGPDLARPETGSRVEGKVNRSEGKQLEWRNATVKGIKTAGTLNKYILIDNYLLRENDL